MKIWLKKYTRIILKGKNGCGHVFNFLFRPKISSGAKGRTLEMELKPRIWALIVFFTPIIIFEKLRGK